MEHREALLALRQFLSTQILGQEKLIERLLIALLADGHLLVEGAPGLAKTKALKELAKEMRYHLGKAMKLRHVPELHFHYDDSVDRGERIDNLLRESPDAATGEAGGSDD